MSSLYGILALLSIVGISAVTSLDILDTSKDWNPLGLKGSWGARWLSRTLTDKADDAYHGGAKHDVKFSPKTGIGSIVNNLASSRGEEGRKGRQRSDDGAQEAYSLAVKKWLRFARDIDPSNFNAFFVYHNWLVEGFSTVEVGEDGHEENQPDDLKSNGGAPMGGFQRIASLQEALEASDIFFMNLKLENKLDCSNACIGLWMRYETEIQLHPQKRSIDSLSEMLAKMKSLRALGEKLGEGVASPYDTNQSTQYANALIKNIGEFIRQ